MFKVLLFSGYIFIHMIVGLIMSLKCLKLETFLEHLNTYFLVRYFLMYKVTSPTVLKSLGLFVSEIISMMQWASCSLLVTSLSIVLAARFRVFNNHMRSNKVQVCGGCGRYFYNLFIYTVQYMLSPSLMIHC